LPPSDAHKAGTLDRLLWVKSWPGLLGLIAVALIASFFAFGFWDPYWRNADPDIMMIYQGFLLGDGRPQDFFVTPGHLTILLIDAWFQLLHALGFLDVVALSDIPKASDAAGFDRAWTAAVRAGRILSLVTAITFVGAFALAIRRLVADWRVAALATLMLALSTGVMFGARTMRTDLLTAGLEILGLLLLLIAARSPTVSYRPFLIGLAAMLCTLGMVNKVQAIFMVASWPVITLLFGVRTQAPARLWRQPLWAGVVILALVAVLGFTARPVTELFEVAFAARSTSIYPFPPPLFGILGLYQAVLAGYVAAAVIAFAWIWRVPWLETLATLVAIALGVALGLLSIKPHYHPQNAISVINFLEHMLVWASFSDPSLGSGGGILSLRLLQSLAGGLYEVFAHATFVLHPSSRAIMFLQWIVFAGLYVAWTRGQRQLVAQVAILLAAAWFIDMAASLRGSKIDYDILSDTVIVVAAAWLFGNLPELAEHRLAFRIGVALIVLGVVFGQSQPLRASLLLRRSPERTCEWLPTFAKLIERFPYCPPKT
jgi:hypothetical protein